MHEERSPAALLRRIKEEAKRVVRSGRGKHMQALESLAIAQGYSCYHELEKAAGNDLATARLDELVQVLSPPTPSAIAHRVRIGNSGWSLFAGVAGPRLYLEYRPPGGADDESSVSDIGLFQLLQIDSKLLGGRRGNGQTWVVTRYGLHRRHTLDFMSDEEVAALSREFGIPFPHDVDNRGQQLCSETAFYKSRSFRQLRRALRVGLIPLPSLSHWNYGLSPLWAHFVAGTDELLEQIDQIVDSCSGSRFSELTRVNRRLEELWPQVALLGESGQGLNYGFLER